jgi:guanidinopropionase
MDEAKLQRLRDRYAGRGGGEFHDPEFKAVAESQFQGDRRKWPFAEPGTFLGAAYRPDALAQSFAALDAALIGVPMDLGVTNRAGARLGPRAVRAVERIGPFEHVLRRTPLTRLRVADVGDVPFRSRYSLESCHEDLVEHYAKIVAAGVMPFSVGGDHSMTYSILRAVGAARPVGLLHIDAHADTSGPYEGSRFHHGGPFRQAVLDGVLDPERTIQIGIRGGAEYLWEFSYESGMAVVHAEDVAERGVRDVVAQARTVLGDGPVYISFDVDALDPAFAPGTGTPEIGGLTPREALAILRGVAGVDVVGGDVVEVAPQYDATTNTAQAGAQMLFTILSLADIAHERRGAR